MPPGTGRENTNAGRAWREKTRWDSRPVRRGRRGMEGPVGRRPGRQTRPPDPAARITVLLAATATLGRHGIPLLRLTTQLRPMRQLGGSMQPLLQTQK